MKFQDINPNNARIFIDYRKNKDKVRFERVGNTNFFVVGMRTILYIGLKYGLIYIPIFFLLFFKNISFYPLIYRIGLFLAFFDIYVVFIVSGGLILSKTKLIRFMPKINAFGRKTYYVIFDMAKVKNKKIEIPLFRNIRLHYKADRDFSKCLEKVEIIEHPFNFELVKRNGERREYPQEYLWKAIFYFKRKPKDGTLRVRFA